MNQKAQLPSIDFIANIVPNLFCTIQNYKPMKTLIQALKITNVSFVEKLTVPKKLCMTITKLFIQKLKKHFLVMFVEKCYETNIN